MLTHEEMIGLQAEKHDLIDPIDFESREKYVLHLIHSIKVKLYHHLVRT